jgi:uncharacterized protein (DUF1501 family)
MPERRKTLDLIRGLNQANMAEDDTEFAARINAYDLAILLQSAAPDLLDVSKESPQTLEMYGIHNKPDTYALQNKSLDPARYAVNCLLARRLVERGVRFIQLFHSSWDDHTELNKRLKSNCEMTDQPTAALIKDLKQRGLLDSTLVVWAGEFGRTPMVERSKNVEGDNRGRDHHPFAFTILLAGGGIKPGTVIGATDELGLNIVEDKVTVHDLHATMLHCLGLDHEKLTFRSQGRDFRLTDVSGQVVTKILR